MRRRTLVAATICAPLAARADTPAPAAPIAAFNDALLAVMKAGATAPFDSRVQLLQPVVERSFDLPLILRNSIGPRWTSFTPAQQKDLLDAFIQFTVATWVANFDSYDGERIEILPELRKVGADEVVQSRIVPRSGEPTRLDYVMRRTGDTWKVADILLDGSISRVAVQRSDFRSLLTSGDPGQLIAMLRDRTRTLAAGGK